MTQRQALIYAAILLMGLGATAGWSVHRLAAQKQAATRAAQDLAECQELIATIESLRDRPNLAGAAEMQLNELAVLIEQASDSAKLPRQQLVRIWPDPARRVGDTSYKEKPTQLLIREVSMQQITQFLYELTQADNNLTVTSLRLTAPRGASINSRWTAEATLSYLIYAPMAKPGQRTGTGSFASLGEQK